MKELTKEEIEKRLLEDFGKHIRNLRIERELTQEEASLICEVNTHYLSDLENGRKNPTLKVLYRISEGYNIPLEELVSF